MIIGPVAAEVRRQSGVGAVAVGSYVLGSGAGPSAVVTQLASWIRELRPSLFSMFVTWVVTVRSEIKSLAAICWLVSPSAIKCAISSSRRVREFAGRGTRDVCG